MPDPKQVAEAVERLRADLANGDIVTSAADDIRTVLAALSEAERQAQGHAARAQLSTAERQELYTLMGQWSSSIDQQFQYVADWINVRAAAAQRAEEDALIQAAIEQGYEYGWGLARGNDEAAKPTPQTVRERVKEQSHER